MTDVVLVPGAGGVATLYWRLVSARLERAGHRALPVDLPGGDPDSGLPEYVALVVSAIRDSAEPLVVAQSLGGFSAVMACDWVQARGLVFVNAMVPALGETPREWWEATGAIDARVASAKAGGYSEEFDVETYFLHDLGPEDAASVLANPGYESDVAFRQSCDVARWPDVPTAAVIGRDDRLFPLEFQRQVLQERAGIDATVISGGHLLALANPDGLVEVLLKLAT